VFFYAVMAALMKTTRIKTATVLFTLYPPTSPKLYGDPQQLVNKGLSGNELRDYLTQIRSTKQIVLMDACHSGGALKGMNVRAIAGDEKAIVQLAGVLA